MKKLEWSTVQRTPNELQAQTINPRKISDEKRAKLIASLKKFGDFSIITVDFDNSILSGHQRCTAMQAIGNGEVLIDVRIPNRLLSEKEKKSIMLIANEHSGEYDFDLLGQFFADVDFDGLGMSELKMDLLDFEMDLMPNENDKENDNSITKTAEEDNFEPPLIEEVTTNIKQGDLITFEKNDNVLHRLLCGDSTKREDVEVLMNEEKADMVFTDPPYNVKIKSLGNSSRYDMKLRRNVKATNGIGQIHGEFQMGSGEMDKAQFPEFLQNAMKRCIENSIDGSIHYIFMDWKHIFEIITAGQVYTELKNLCIWNKDNGGMGTFYRSKHELCFVFKNGKEKHINNFMLGQFGRHRTNVWDYPSMGSFAKQNDATTDSNETKLHPTIKPLKMVGDAILDCSNKGSLILDVFLGSGSTMVAAHQLDRRCYGMELEPKYCQVIIDRMKRLDADLIIKINGIEL